MYYLTITAARDLSQASRDFMVDLASEEARKVIPAFAFTIHDAHESKRYLKLLIEGSHAALLNLVSVLADNLPYRISHRRLR